MNDCATRTMKMKFNVRCVFIFFKDDSIYILMPIPPEILPRQNLINIFRKSEVTRTGMFTTKEGVGDVLPPASVQVVIIIVLKYFSYTSLILLLYFMQYFHSIIASTEIGPSGIYILTNICGHKLEFDTFTRF